MKEKDIRGGRAATRILLFLALVFLTAVPVFAADTAVTPTPTPIQQAVTTEKATCKAGWIKKKSKYYWRQSDGTILKKYGYVKLGSHWYFLKKDGSRAEKVFKKIKGSYYYFGKKGAQYIPSKSKFRTISKKTYYFYSGTGKVATGRVKIGKKYYYFDSSGQLKKNKAKIKIGKILYETNADGVMKKTTAKRAQCRKAAQAFIKKHSSSSQSNAAKFRSCFNYMNWYMRYSPGYFSVSSDYSIIRKKEGAYELALSMFNSPNLRGNCHRFAACVAAVAKELGYSPTMVTITGDHSYVVINGKYYDNSGGRFGASRPSVRGTIYKTFKF